jgi:hypothetical protein
MVYIFIINIGGNIINLTSQNMTSQNLYNQDQHLNKYSKQIFIFVIILFYDIMQLNYQISLSNWWMKREYLKFDIENFKIIDQSNETTEIINNQFDNAKKIFIIIL